MHKVAVVAHQDKLQPSVRRALIAALDTAGVDAPWTVVPKAKKATKAVAQAVEEGATTVIVCGGDGTVRAAAQAVVGTEIVLAVIPVGTANLFANAFGLPSDPSEVVELVARRSFRTIDSAICNELTFNVMAGTGFDAAMIDGADAHKERLGMLAYLRAGIRDARTRDPFAVKVSVDDEPFYAGDATCVLVGNIGTLKGGLTAFPDASPTDGRLDVAVVTAQGLKQWAGVLVSAARRTQAASSHAHLGQGSTIAVRLAEKHRFQLDGGTKGSARRLDFTVRPSSLRICAPEH